MSKTFFILLAIIGLLVSCARSTAVTGPKYTASAQLTQGKTIYQNSCNRCHELPDVKKHDDAGWLNTMSRMAPRAKLSVEQHQMVYDYLISVNNQ